MDKLKTRILLMSMIVILLFSIQAAAANSNDNVTLAGESIDLSICDNVNDVKTENTLTAINTDDVLGEGKGNFTELQILIDSHYNGELILNKSYKCNGESGITISSPITIYGNGHTLDGNHEVRIFNVVSSDVVVHDLTFVNGNTTSGGAMRDGSAVNCTFTNNTAQYGGAMWDVSAANCTFTGNTATYGGAMYTGSAVNCTFTNNTSTKNGGAMATGYAENSIFKDNYLTNGKNNDLYVTSSKNCIFISAASTTAESVAYSEDIVFEAANDIPDSIDNPVIIFNNNEISDKETISINGRKITVTGLNVEDNYEICYYNKTINDNGDETYNRIKVSVLKANSTVKADDTAVLYGNPISIPVTSANAINVTYKIINNTGEVVANGTINPNAAITVTGLPIGKYTVNLTTAVDENHNSATNTSKLMITDGTTFWDLNNTINGNNDKDVYLNGNYKYNPDTDSDFKNGIYIKRNVTVHGNGHTLDGNHEESIFSASSDVVVHDITFINGKAYGGGAMFGGTAINCTFTNNTATFGGAMQGGSAINCTFTNNNATYRGGAIDTSSAIDCTFTNNNAKEGGGAMEVGSAVNCTFTDNTAQVGGAIDTGSAVNCTFTNNTADYGGAMYSGSAENSIFKDNHLKNGEYNDLFKTSTNNSIFVSPTSTTVSVAYSQDIVIEAANDIPDSIENPVIIFNNNEIINTATISINGREITISGLNIEDNYEICYYNKTIDETLGDKQYNRVKASVLKANSTVKAEDTAVLYGNPISIPVTSTNATNVTYKIINNTGEVVANGTIKPNAAITVTGLPTGKYTVNLTTAVDETHNPAINTSKLMITDGTTFWDLNNAINGNKDKDVYLNGNYKYNPETDSDFKNGILIKRNVTVHGNGHTLDGNHEARIFQVTASDVVVHDITFVNGNSTTGGAMHGGSAVNCTFTNNTATNKGGAMYSSSAINCTFTNNNATRGGAIYECSAINCTFTNNIATNDGGAMYRSSAENCTFTNNTATLGGAMYSGSAINCTFTNNTATLGGAMHSGSAENCTFTNNTATNDGGAMQGGSAINCTFTNNTATRGGAMNRGSAVNCTFTNNTATRGGAMHHSSAVNCTFTNNTADYGGAMYSGSAENSIFKDNHRTNGKNNDLDATTSNNCIFISPTSTTAKSVAYSQDIVIEAANDIPDSIENPVIIFNNNKIINTATISINGREITISGLNTTGNYEICYYNETINDNGDKNYNRVKLDLLKANMTIDFVTTGDLVVDGIVNVTFTLPTDIDGNVMVTIDEEAVTGFAIDNGTVTIPGSYDVGNHTVTVNITGDTHYNDATGSTTFNIGKGNSTITITNYTSPISIGDDTTVAFKINRDVMDNAVTLWIDDTEILTYDFETNEDSFLITKDKFPSEGTYNITVQYRGNSRYNASNIASCIIAVEKNNVTMNVEGSTVYYGDNATINVTGLPDDAKGNVSVRVGDGIFFAYIKNGTAVIEIPDLLVDEYEGQTVKYSGDRKYNNASGDATIIVKPASSKIVIDPICNVTYGEDVVVTYSVENETSLNITVTAANGSTITKGIDAGVKGKVVISALDAGEYSIAISNAEKGNYLGCDAEATFKVFKANSTISAADINVTYGEAIVIPLTSQNATNVTYIILDWEGICIANATIPAGENIKGLDLARGKYTVNVTTLTDKNHIPKTNTSRLIVKPAGASISAKDVNVSYGDAIVIEVNVVNATEFSYFILNEKGKIIDSHIIDAGMNITLENLPAGDYNVSLISGADENHTSVSNSSKLHVRHVVEILLDAVSGSAGDSINITAMFMYEDGTAVNDGVASLSVRYDKREVLSASLYSTLRADQSVDVSDGKATFSITLGEPGTYPYVVSYSGDDVDDVQSESSLTITKLNTSVSADDISGRKGEKRDIAITVLDKNNRAVSNGTVTLTLNGQPYDAAVDNGRATVSVVLPNPGSYEATVKYNGNDYYNSSTSSINVNVKKESTRAPSVKNVVGKAGAKTDIPVEIVDGDGNPVKNGTVTLTIDGRTYTAEVINGVATFKDVVIPSKDTVADVYYHGNEYYNASSTTFSIKVQSDNETVENSTEHVSFKADDGNATGNPIAILLLALFTLFVTYRKK